MAQLLHPALRLLLRKQFKARLRKFTRGAGTMRGKLRLIAFFTLFIVWSGSMAFVAAFHEPSADPARGASMVASGLFALMILTVVGNGPDAGVMFLPSEVDILFPAPFRRRDLLAYRLAGNAFGAVFSAFFFSLVALTYATHWLFAFLGFALAIQFVQLISTTLGLIISIVGQTAYTRARKIALAAVTVIAGVGILQAGGFSFEEGVTEWTRRFAATPVGAILLAPVQVYAGAITAEFFFPNFLRWVALAVVINGALVFVALGLDANFLERSAAASQRAYLRLQRMRAGQGWMNLAKPSGVRLRIPMLARLNGAGPVAWRQLIAAMRGSKGIVYFVIIVAVIMGFSFARLPAVSLSGMAMGILPMMGITLLPQMLRFDFRGDIDSFDALKTLPVSPLAIAVGELIAPMVFATLLEIPCALAIGFFSDEWGGALAVAAFIPVVNLLIFALENLMFLWYPHRNTNTADFSGMGRRMLTTLAKLLTVAMASGLATVAGVIAYWVFERSWAAGISAAWLLLAACALAMVPLVARAFRRMDPSSILLD